MRSRRIYTISLTLIGVAIVSRVANFADATPTANIIKDQIIPIRLSTPGDNQMAMSQTLMQKTYNQICEPSTDTTGKINDCLKHDNDAKIMIANCINEEMVYTCYEEAFGVDYGIDDKAQRKEVMCKNREQFGTMTDCFIKRHSAMSLTEMLDESDTDYLSCILVGVLESEARTFDNGSTDDVAANVASANIMERHPMQHSHLSHKVFNQACGNETVYAIDLCLTSSSYLNRLTWCMKRGLAISCYKEAYSVDLELKEPLRNRDSICEDHEKFKTMTDCFFRTFEEIKIDLKKYDDDEFVAFGLCTINLLSGWT